MNKKAESSSSPQHQTSVPTTPADSSSPPELISESSLPPRSPDPPRAPQGTSAIPGGDGGTTVDAQVIFGEEQLADGAKWAEEREGRKFMQEQERVGWHLAELVGDNLETPLRLNAIRVVGAKHTRPSFLASLIEPYLPQLPPASYLSAEPHPNPSPQNLRKLLATTRELNGLFSQFDIFSQVEASLEGSPSYLAEPEDVDIVLNVKEASRYFLRTATDIGDGEGSANGTARIRNAFGGAETLEGNVSFGTRTKSAFQLRLDTPVRGSPFTKADISIFAAQRDLTYYASCSEITRGAQARLRTTSRFGFHEIAYDATLRRLADLLPTASMTLREAAGTSLKSSISHSFIQDTRDDPFLPSRGSYLKLRQEYAGLGGDANFVKLEGESSAARDLGHGFTASLGFRSGLLYPFGTGSSEFVDRFHLGGPTSVRGFRPNSMGPKDNVDYIGGDLHWASGLSLIAPFPSKPDWPLKTHFFLNAGRLISLEKERTVVDTISDLVSKPSVTVGLGLMYRHSLVRIEGNIGVPLAAGAQEGSVKGLQFGLGMSFL